MHITRRTGGFVVTTGEDTQRGLRDSMCMFRGVHSSAAVLEQPLTHQTQSSCIELCNDSLALFSISYHSNFIP